MSIQGPFKAIEDGSAELANIRFVFKGIEVGVFNDGVIVSGKRIRLSPSECKILRLLTACQGNPVSRDALEANLYAGRAAGPGNSIDVQICRLRSKISKASPRWRIPLTSDGYSVAYAADRTKH